MLGLTGPTKTPHKTTKNQDQHKQNRRGEVERYKRQRGGKQGRKTKTRYKKLQKKMRNPQQLNQEMTIIATKEESQKQKRKGGALMTRQWGEEQSLPNKKIKQKKCG